MEGLSYNKKSILEKTDTTPTANSTNNVTSGGVKTYVDAADAVLQGEITNLENRLTNPFTYKGSVAATSNLPGSGNTVNDVYFVEAENCLYAWNGSAWGKASTNDYEKILGELAAAFDAAKVYKKGELVLYNDGVWVRKADATQADGSWVAANWTATDLGTEIANVNNALTTYLGKMMPSLNMHNEWDASNVPLTLGYYNGSYAWTADNRFATNKYLPLVFDRRLILYLHVDESFSNAWIQAFDILTNTRVANQPINSTSRSTRLITKPGLYYYFLVQRSSGFLTPPTEGFSFLVNDVGNESIELIDSSKVTGDILTTGKHSVSDTLEYLYYNSSSAYVIIDGDRHSCPRKLYRFPNDTTVKMYTSISGVTCYIKEFELVGDSYVGIHQYAGNPAIRKTSSNYVYSFDFYRDSSSWSETPVINQNCFIEAYSDYYDDKGSGGGGDPTDFTIQYNYSASTKELTLITNCCKYVIQRVTNNSINIDSWRLYSGSIRIGSEFFNMWTNSDAEGPIKIDNEPDFIGGYHGDELLVNAQIYLDNSLLDFNADSSGTCESVMLYQESNCYRVDSSTKAFTRYKRVRIVGNNFDVQQRWVSDVSCTITRGALCLMQCPKEHIVGWDTDLLIPMRGKNTGMSLEKNTRRCNIYLDDNKTISLVPEVGMDNQYFTPSMTNFADQDRLKCYFDMYNGRQLQPGDEVLSKFSFQVNALQ